MRKGLLALLVLAVLAVAWRGCRNEPDTASDGAAATTAPPRASETQDPPPAADPAAATRRTASDAATHAASSLHAYLGALPGKDTARADAWWAGGDPGTPPGDALLRGIDGLRSLRIQTYTPLPLDRESPPRAFEIPVNLRLVLDGGRTPRVEGHYRLRARVDGQGWEITSAELQPQLD